MTHRAAGAQSLRPSIDPSLLVWVASFVVIVVVAFAGARALMAPSALSGPIVVPTNPAIEERWGARVTHVAVTGDGGLIELRFVVLDSDKALALMTEVENVPVLQVEGSGDYVWSAAMMTSQHGVAPGRSSFLLYRNGNGAIRPGTLVTILFGDLRLEHVQAQ